MPDASISFGFNPLVLEAAAADDRIRCGLWVSPRPQDAELNTAALALAGEHGVAALKTSFLLGGRADDAACQEQLDRIFGTAREHGLFASDEPWGDFSGELARMRTAAGDGSLGQSMLRDNFAALYDTKS